MTTHKDILGLIEVVDPEDTDKLDEIDARVWCWLNNGEFLRTKFFGTLVQYIDLTDGKTKGHSFHTQYTRSRDAIKGIRPGGCLFSIQVLEDGCAEVAYLYPPNEDDICLDSPKLPTEELAELHAIIQTIAHERGE